MASGTNLFDFAPRELSQSAFWAWVLQSTDPPQQDRDVAELGEELLRRVGAPIPQDSIEVETERPLGGAGRVDIYAEIDGKETLLIEHKVSASLQAGQLARYRASVDETVYCLFLSVSYDLHKRRTMESFPEVSEWSILDAERLVDILESSASSHPLVVDYRAWLTDRVDQWNRLETGALSTEKANRREALKTVQGQWRFMQYVTRGFSADGRQYGHRDRRGGAPWTEFRFVENAQERDALLYRIERLSEGPVFRLRQWQPDPNPSWNEKKDRRDELRTLWQDCLDQVGELEWATPRNWGEESCEVARISLLDCTTSELADELAAVHPRFVERVEEQFGWSVGRNVYSYTCRECEAEFEVEQDISEYGTQLFPPDRCSECAV